MDKMSKSEREERNIYLWTKCPQEKKERTGGNDKIIHENVSAMVKILKGNFFE